MNDELSLERIIRPRPWPGTKIHIAEQLPELSTKSINRNHYYMSTEVYRRDGEDFPVWYLMPEYKK